MKYLSLPAFFAVAINAHTIGQRLSVNGVEFPSLKGVRAPRNNWPLWISSLCNITPEYCPKDDVAKPSFACNDENPYNPSTPDVIDVPAGARVGMYWWGCVKDRNPEDCQYFDETMPGTHQGPMIYYLAKVDDAATTNTTGLDWFKIGQDGLDLSTDPGQWGTVYHLFDNDGWGYVDMPSCLASGNYLLRAEAISLHTAVDHWHEGTQHFVSCANINIVGGGSWKGSNHLQFPGAYNASDPGLWDNNGLPGSWGWDNLRKPYTPPGGPVQTCPVAEGSVHSVKFVSGS